MKKSNILNGIKHIHFVGIGGISMSALAKICLSNGIFVSGSDRQKNNLTEELEHLGAKIFYRHAKENIENADIVVYTCAVGEDNEEVVFAKQKNIRLLERAEFLGKIAEGYDNVIAVAGSHGKTTVCGMIGKIFEIDGKNPTLLVGGELENGENLVLGGKKFLIAEACEYKEHFLKIPHDLGVILNIDYDHPDYYKKVSDYQKAFEKFSNMSRKMTIIDEKYKIFVGENFISFGEGGNFFAKHILNFQNKIIFDTYKNGKFFCKITINLIGSYNVQNALCSIAVADYYGIDKKNIKDALSQFQNLKRRYEYMGKIGNNIVITDYAHHPTQIENCIKATRELYSNPITVVFEPHTYSRTKKFLTQFVSSLSNADKIILLPTYPAREKVIAGGRAKDLYNALKFKKSDVIYVKNYKKCKKILENFDKNIILILGAGSIIELAECIKKNFLNKDKSI